MIFCMAYMGLIVFCFTILQVICATQAKIGPKGDLVISNVEVAPDGFSRVAALANGIVDGGLISGTKVGFLFHRLSLRTS